MFRSVRRRLILNSLLVALVSILAVGVVTLILVDRYFVAQEQNYLEQRAEVVMPFFVKVFSTSTADDVESLVQLTAFFSDVRIELLNKNRDVVVDSGPRDTNRPFVPGDGRIDSGRFGMRVHDDGSVQVVRNNVLQESRAPFVTEPSLEFSADSPITAISSASVAYPLQTDDGETIGFLRFSEGPAAGEGVIRSIQNALIGGSIAALLVAIIVGSISGQQIAGPLGNLKNAAMAMAEDDLQARAPQGKLVEFNQLASQFNKMADQISGNIDRLETERTVLKRMIADASHELRTPLTALKTFNTLLQDEINGPMATHLIEESSLQIEQLYRMTTGLLDLSRLEARLAGTEFIKADLRNTISATVESLKPLADSRQQTVHLTLPIAPITLRHDDDALQQAIGNILINALKYSPEGSSVYIDTQIDQQIELYIRDEGDGISAEALPYIFDRFYRDPSQQSEGTGLGLAIAKEIVSIHGGKIRVMSDQGTGSTFTITLPFNETT